MSEADMQLSETGPPCASAPNNLSIRVLVPVALDANAPTSAADSHGILWSVTRTERCSTPWRCQRTDSGLPVRVIAFEPPRLRRPGNAKGYQGQIHPHLLI